MADQEQVERLKHSVHDWNQWRQDHPEVHPDLFKADLSKTNLFGADLHSADLRTADLSSANLMGANLNESYFIRAELMGANLSDVNLMGVNLIAAHLNEANLMGANLIAARLFGADLDNADLRAADLHAADLSGADLNGANLSGADLSGTALIGSNLSRADLNEANLDNAQVGWTLFCNLNLCSVKGLETLRHEAPSSIGIETIIRSEGNIPEVFLRGIGLDDTFINYVLSLAKQPIQYYSCFLSYSNKDQDFVDRLYADLQSKGVRCWYAPHELKPGDYYRHEIGKSIRVYDKLVLVLSQHSAESEWVEDEVNIALKREESMNMTRQVLFPLRLDHAVMESRRGWVRSLRYHRHIADFTCWKDHDAYRKVFERLLHDLQANNPPTA